MFRTTGTIFSIALIAWSLWQVCAGPPDRGYVEVVASAVSDVDLHVGQLAQHREIETVPVEEGNATPLLCPYGRRRRRTSSSR